MSESPAQADNEGASPELTRSITMHPKRESSSTDVADFIESLEGGNTENMLSAALSIVAAGVVNTGKKGGEVNLKLKFEHVKGTSQVIVGCEVAMKAPTTRGQKRETDIGSTTMYVGEGGKLSLLPPKIDMHGQTSIHEAKKA